MEKDLFGAGTDISCDIGNDLDLEIVDQRKPAGWRELGSAGHFSAALQCATEPNSALS
jgi:hypothetical protein